MFGDILWPSEAMEPILARPVRAALVEWLTEISAEEALRAVGIGPRKRAIFDGPPGVGKTTLAHHLAARLGLPMVAVRPERLISKWLGETGQNVGALFDCAAAGIVRESGDSEEIVPVVLFLDEFDAVSRERRVAQQGADDERNAYVNTLLQRIEQHEGFLIAATNFGGHIDPAIWRRFDMHVTLALPGQPERQRILARYLSPYGLPPDALFALAEAFETASPALMRAFCESIKRQIIVGPLLDNDMRLVPTIERILASVQPHPGAGTPRLWALAERDYALTLIPWPLPKAVEIEEAAKSKSPPATDNNVVSFAVARQ
jgi:SpoVK/Ycf46/Vps4 family AAA+-type ATPase